MSKKKNKEKKLPSDELIDLVAGVDENADDVEGPSAEIIGGGTKPEESLGEVPKEELLPESKAKEEEAAIEAEVSRRVALALDQVSEEELEVRLSEKSADRPIYKVQAYGGDGVVGFYEQKRKRDGDVFIVKDEIEFSSAWMLPIGWKPVERKARAEAIRTGVIRQRSRKDLKSTAKQKAQAGAKLSLSQIAGVTKLDTEKAVI